MNYTIASMREHGGMQVIGIDKSGNKYTVWHRNKGNSKFTHKTFDTIDEAESVFFALAKCFTRGEYSAEDRAAMLSAL